MTRLHPIVARPNASAHMRSPATGRQASGQYVPGHCGVTSSDYPNDCEAGGSGSFLLGSVFPSTPWATTSIQRLAHVCQSLCEACARCRFISLSMRFRDCSWYFACDLQNTITTPAGFVSRAMTNRIRGKPAAVDGPCFAPGSRTPLGDGAHHERPAFVDESVLYMSCVCGIAGTNALERIHMLLSAFALQHLRPNVTWRVIDGGPWRLATQRPVSDAPHVRRLFDLVTRHLWRNGSVLRVADTFHDDFVLDESRRSTRRSSSHPRSWRRTRCYAGEAFVASYSPLYDAFQSRAGQQAILSFQSIVYSHLGRRRRLAPPLAALPLPVPHAQAAGTSLQAALMQRRGVQGQAAGREILNEPEVLTTLREAGFASEVVLPPELPLHRLVHRMASARLLVTFHGAAMVNQFFMAFGRATVLEVFPPDMVCTRHPSPSGGMWAEGGISIDGERRPKCPPNFSSGERALPLKWGGDFGQKGSCALYLLAVPRLLKPARCALTAVRVYDAPVLNLCAQIYGTSFEMASQAHFQHLSLFLGWSDLALPDAHDVAAFRRTEFSSWTNEHDAVPWDGARLAREVDACIQRPAENIFASSLCTVRQPQARVPPSSYLN